LLGRYYNTLKYLKFIQIKHQLKYRLISINSLYAKLLRKDNFSVPVSLQFTEWINKPDSYLEKAFRFLNLSNKFEDNEIDWDFDSNGKLWTYNLNYMDYLLQENMTEENGLKLMDNYVDNFPLNKNGKEPYTISLRGINWVKFLSKFTITNEKLNRSLLLQYNLLYNRLEYHLLGNHLLENGFSLLFGAFYFKSAKYYNKSKTILFNELNEQILEDGGHFELSPMYHQIILDRLLDSINLIKNNEVFDDQDELLDIMTKKAISMLVWIRNMSFSNGDIPHFNDSTFGIAPTSEQLFDYAKRLNLNLNLNLSLTSSGYRKFKTNNYKCIVDIGQLGPDYIPGHAHADMLSFVLYYKELPLIVDTSVSTYEKNQTRQLERSTSSHNTVVVNNKNQSDVWGGFRVGKRACLTIVEDKADRVSAHHNGYNPIIHTRLFIFDSTKIEVIDQLSKTNERDSSYLHFHPDRKVEFTKNSLLIDGIIYISFTGNIKIELQDYNYPLGYNKYAFAKKCKIDFNSVLKTKIEFHEN
jgi:hypothetical protein